MPALVHVIANQKGGVGKTTVAMNLAAVTYQALAAPPALFLATALDEPTGDPTSPVLVVSTDPQASSVWWSQRAEQTGRLPFDFTQVLDPAELANLRQLPYRHVFVDTPGSLADEGILLATLAQADDVLVPMVPEALSFDPTARTIEHVIVPRGIPYRVVINAWDPRDGDKDLTETAQYVVARAWPFCTTVIRRYKIHTRASAEGTVCTQYPANRVAAEARQDFFQLALELGYGGTP